VIWNPAVESLPRDSMRAMQLERLRAAVAWAGERVPFYRNALAEAGLEPSTLKSFEDLERLPFTRKTHLREHYPWGLFAVPQSQLTRIHASSGTKGKPTVVGYTRATSRPGER
jgi:phenylacetate-CoA ligase